MRVGTGWDIHRLTEGRDLVLGGVRIDSPKGCLGHSDGDALIHAVIDSLLGACSLGDIGTLFPDTDPRYKGISSAVLLENVVSLVRENGYKIINVDTTVILQSPKLGPYKDAMRKRMSELLGVEENCFCVKAKTAEHMLGELGTGDAVVCQCACLVERI
ncbi:MAG: 2-C-methyl-D-erythritol 2,4-cyclodiphosphate synthase [Spirochaetales bacterium]|nr:2-C-methyl-D-erythritol 2,4-cyclodiphosphate synthase [Spirochaetales bacterium]